MTKQEKSVVLVNSVVAAVVGAILGGLIGQTPEQKAQLPGIGAGTFFLVFAFVDIIKSL